MNQLPLNDEIVKKILSNKEGLLISIQDKIYKVRQDISRTDEMIEIASFGSSSISDMPKGKGHHSDLGDTYLKYLNMLKKRKNEYNDLLWNLILQEQRIERVWLAFMMLGEPYYTLLLKLYVNGEKYEATEVEYGYSHPVFESNRKRGINSIIRIYNLNLSIVELEMMAGSETQNRKEVHAKKTAANENYQIKLDDLFNDGICG